MATINIVKFTNPAGFSHELLVSLRELDLVTRIDGLKLESDGRYREFDAYLASPQAADLMLKLAIKNFPGTTMQR